MEEPNISLQKFSVIKDMADEKSSDLSHSKYCDITSKNTKKSAFSLLTRLRSKNIRKRNFGSSAVIGARELDRYFPDRRLRLYVATWNMEGKDYPQNLEDLLLPSDNTKDIYVIGVQEGCPNSLRTPLIFVVAAPILINIHPFLLTYWAYIPIPIIKSVK
ncbi:phosphatidylinositol polyphosphate 5-phosphatase type IV-like [Rhinoderma darwinii]|uniref:phosphatidylinositol polyphosphate 5-phosphatase type IV-like n=1 Tax=Rhinoderma darwinii TaxID=43563 RepID=UPI003F6705FE